MIKSEKYRIMQIDLKRAFISYRFIFSIILGVAVCYFTFLFCGSFRTETIHMFLMIHDRSQSFLAYIVGILPYALCFYDDFAYGNIKNEVGRIRISDYVFSKTVVAVLSTISAFILGKICFVIVYSFKSPVCLPETLTTIYTVMFMDLIEEGHYLAYFFLSSLPKALYCALLCQIVMLISVIIPNKSVVFCIPIAVFYIFNFYVRKLIKDVFFNFSIIFDGITQIFDNDWIGLGYALLIAFLLYCTLYRITLFLIRRKVHNE